MLLCIFDAKKGCKKKSLNKFSLAADLLNHLDVGFLIRIQGSKRRRFGCAYHVEKRRELRFRNLN